MTTASASAQQGVCHYCGLPIPGYLASESANDSSPEYCCIGCSFAAKITSETGDAGEERMAMTKLGLAVFFAMSVMVFSLLLWSEQDARSDTATELVMAASFYDVARYLSLLFSIPVLLLLGAPVVENAIRETRRGRLNTDFLLAAGVLASFGYSAYHVFIDAGHVYFEVACAILVAVTLGKWLEAHCKRQMTESLAALAKLLPASVHYVDAQGEITDRNLEEVVAGDVIRIHAGERIAVDGDILTGQALLDEQILTGEAEPTLRGAGERVLAGALNLDGELSVRSVVAGGQGAISRIVDAVTNAARAKSKPQILAERIAAWFLPAVMVLAAATFLIHSYSSDLYTGVSNALCVVLIACPCALGLATPLAIWAGIGRASREQILVREGDSLCQLGAIRVVAFDKTGTLTTGAALTEDAIESLEWDAATCGRIAKRLAEGSRHLYSQAIREQFATAAGWDLEEVRTAVGRGVIAVDPQSKQQVILGSRRFLRESGFEFPAALESRLDQAEAKGLGISLLGIGKKVAASYFFSEQLREGASQTIADLRQRGIDVVLLSGDHSRRVALIAEQLAIPFQAGLLPEEKLAAIENLRREFGVVAMVGDGVNDAPALASADVGIALGCGADVSREAAAVCLLGNQLSRVAQAIELGIQTKRTVRWNLIWTFIYNLMGLSLAVAGRLHPAVAAAAMVASSLMVVIQSLRLANLEFPARDARALAPDQSADSIGLGQTEENHFLETPVAA